MNDAPKPPIIIYWIRREGEPELGFGYLIHQPDGRCWCFPGEETAGKQPSLAGGFQIDLSRLREQSDTGADRKLYLYEAEVAAPLEGSRTHSPIQGRFQGKQN